MTKRKVTRQYDDPLDLVWMQCARDVGISVVRDDEVFASWDGKGSLRIGLNELDADDCLAQLVLHELCHALIEGPEAFGLADWGLNDPPAPRVHEFAALRLQATLADRFELRKFLSATTDFFEYYLALSENPLSERILTDHDFSCLRPLKAEEDEQAIEMASAAFDRWKNSNWRPAMESALRATRDILELIRPIAPANSVFLD